jgi:diguanylate cyclase (GGDEF)-like protein/PAS domain S-box-containing protein
MGHAEPIAAGVPTDEAGAERRRLDALHGYAILDTAPEAAFDDFTVLASRLADAPIALISLLDRHRQWFKSRVGLDAAETPREWAFCEHAIRGDGVLEVPDALADPRFARNPLVTGDPGVRYYAGAPLVTPGGQALGTLCVIDRRPRRLDPGVLDSLDRLARQVVHLFELRRLGTRERQVTAQLRAQAAEVRRLALVAERTNNVVVLSDPQGCIVWANAAFTRVTGYTLHEAVGRRPGALLQFEGTDPAAREMLRAAVRTQTPARTQILNRAKDGRVYWIDIDLQPLFDGAGRCEGFVAVQTDVTELVVQRDHARTLLEALPVGVLVQDRDRRVVDLNPAAERILAAGRAELIGTATRADRWDNVDASGRPLPDDERPIERVLTTGMPVMDMVVGIRAGDRRRRWMRVSCAPVRSPDGSPSGVITAFVDETEARSQGQLLTMAVKAARIATWTWDAERDVVEASAAELLGMGLIRPSLAGPDGIVRAPWLPSIHRDDRPGVESALRRHHLDPSEPFRAEYRWRAPDGAWRWLLSCGAITEYDAGGRPRRLSGVLIDVHESKAAEAALTFAATTDSLTGLPNRAVLRERLEQALAASRRHGHFGALMFLDLDHFKRINDTHGHALGDALLQAVAQRLSALLRADETLARNGGDEMMVLIPFAGHDPEAARQAALALAERLRQAMQAPFRFGGTDFGVGMSVGMTTFPKADGETLEDLIREADIAMYEAKGAGRGVTRQFHSEMQFAVVRRFAIEQDLKHAIARGELSLHVQGKWDPGGALHSAEALLRWQHPERGTVSPAEFIPVAEDCGLILPIGRWVLEQACALAARWRAAGRPMSLAVNVSPKQFRDAGFVEHMDAACAASGADPGDLTLELTENVLIDDTEASAHRMEEIAARGVRLSIDDFGTGYSSLMYLKRLPLHELKIDRAFVRDVMSDAEDAAIVQAMLSIARKFGLQTVAEGVETPAQAAFLTAHGCTLMQGYLFGRPQPAEEFTARILARRR